MKDSVKMKSKIMRKRNLLFLPIILDFAFLFLHLLLASDLQIFNLDAELSFPTAYQGLKLFLVGITSLVVFILLMVGLM